MWSVAMQQRNLFWSPIHSPVLHTNSPLKKRKCNRSQKASYNCLWDGYRGRAGQLLVNIFPVPINSPKSLCEPDPGSLSFLKWRLWPPWRPIAGQLLANFSLFLLTVPEVFAKVNSTQFPYRFQNGRHDVIWKWSIERRTKFHPRVN